jgi:hypothetical protein
MPDSCPCETLWLKNPVELLKPIFTVSDVCESNNINAFSRAFLLALLFSAAFSPFLGAAGFALILLILVVVYGRWLLAKIVPEQRAVQRMASPGKEGFTDPGAPIRPDLKDQGAFATAPITISSPGVVTRPTPANPFMNVLLSEITYNPTRPPADFASNPNNQAVLDDFFRVQWTSDPTDVFGKSQSQREFYTMPSTSIPNDQESFQNWLYLIPGKTCKEGGRDACYPGTNGGPVTWLNKPN